MIPLKLQLSITTESSMKTPALSQIDTGPIVALRIARDQHPKWAVGMSELSPRCRVMTTDADFLNDRRHRRQVIPVIGPPSFRP